MGISVCTLVSGREMALENLVHGLSANRMLPDELIIVLMNDQPRALPKAPFPIRQIRLSQRTGLALSAARNLAASQASGSLLIFLDVDCIPGSTLIESYNEYQAPGYLLNGEVRYLQQGATTGLGWSSRMWELSVPDPIRSSLGEYGHELFWSLNFACTAADYQRISGFDEAFNGYGAEDTDFAFSARANGIGMKRVPAIAYHQFHESFSPPLNHFIDIINNARLFNSKWSRWPMEGWLRAFKEMELIDWDGGELRVLRQPTPQEILLARKT